MGRNRYIAGTLFSAGLCAVSGAAIADTISAKAMVENNSVFVGEAFRFEIHVQGVDHTEEPDLSGLKGMRAQYGGGRKNSSQQVTVVNGRMTSKQQLTYIHSFLLVAEQPGTLTIPRIAVSAGGKTVYTQAIQVQAQKPQDVEGFKLHMELSNGSPYVGEPILLTVTWYIGSDVSDILFNVPALEDDSFYVADRTVNRSRNLFEVPVGTGDAIAEKTKAALDGKQYTAVRFRKVLIPRLSGEYELDPATVSFRAVVGYRNQQQGRRNLFDGFLGGSRRRPVYKKMVVPSKPLTMQVSPRPLDGRPDGFAGHVGTYRIKASATPAKVNVGDPVKLVIALSGTEYLNHIAPPPLASQDSLTRDFKIPSQQPEGETRGGARVFTQTIRALRPDVEWIPPIELPYFDSEKGAYDVARSEPIRIDVRESRVLTAFDAEGIELTDGSTAVEGWAGGIAHNYEDPGVLVDQVYGPVAWISSPAWIAALSLPPLMYGLAAGMILVRKTRRRESLTTRARRALRRLDDVAAEAGEKEPSAISGQTLAALQGYLGCKLDIPTSALTFADAEKPLTARGVQKDLLTELRAVFNACEAGQYGGATDDELRGVAKRARDLARKLEETL
jgi:hypothetical protein